MAAADVITDRYNFNYWPPMPILSERVAPAQTVGQDVVCYGVLYIGDEARRRAVYATGEWADISDFWLQSEDPKPERLRTDDDGQVRVRDGRHLSGASYAVHQLTRHLSWQQGYVEGRSGNALWHTSHYRFLEHRVFNSVEKTASRKNVLIARDVIWRMVEREIDFPMAFSDASQLVLGKVAFRWAEDAALLAS